MRRWIGAGLGALALAAASGCSRTATFANRTAGPVVVSVALLDSGGDQNEVVGAIVDPGKALEISYQPDSWVGGKGGARASVWKGELQRGEPAAVVTLSEPHMSLDLREEDGRLVAGPLVR